QSVPAQNCCLWYHGPGANFNIKMAETAASGRVRQPVSILLVVLSGNAAYLWAFSEPTFWYFVQVAIHRLLALAFAAAVIWALVTRRFRPAALSAAAFALMGGGLALGIAILALGATTRYRTIVDAHAIVSALGAALLAFSWWRTGSRFETPRF